MKRSEIYRNADSVRLNFAPELAWYFKLIFLAIVIAASVVGVCYAHTPGHLQGPDADDRPPTTEELRLMACGTIAVRMAWGAEAYMRGAPPEMKTAPMFKLKEMFYESESVPADGIYVAEELSEHEREDYMWAARLGYDFAHNFPAGVTHEQITATFYRACKEAE